MNQLDSILLQSIKNAIIKTFEEANLIGYFPYNADNNDTRWYLNEEAVMFRFGYHFQCCLNEEKHFERYHLDCNCNTDGMKPIVISGYSKTGRIKPDVVLHVRNSNEYNKLVLEIKMDNSSESARYRDRKKLKELTKDSGDYHYELGVLLIFGTSVQSTKIEVYKDGNKILDMKAVNKGE